MFYFLIFLIVPIVEIMVFIEAGQAIGVLNTIMLTILTAFIGIGLLRVQGVQTLQNARLKMANNETPLAEVFDGLCLFAAGLMLMTPGFVTDTFGFLLFLPPVRLFLRTRVKELPRFFMATDFSSKTMFDMEREAARQKQNTATIEGDYIDITDKTDTADKKDKL